jgi:phytoene dehydrogenase-like protein
MLEQTESIFARQSYDAVVVGSGPNGLAAAIVLLKAGYSVLVLEAKETPGGGARSCELTLPGFVHDVCSAIHPLAFASPFFCTLPLEQYGLHWIRPPVALAHPLDDGTVMLLQRSIEETAVTLGDDGHKYERFMNVLVSRWDEVAHAFLGPLRPASLRHPLALAPFGLPALTSARWLAEHRFSGVRARALFAGLSAHAFLPLEQVTTAASGLVLAMIGHISGWPIPQGGSQCITAALLAYLRALGGEIVTGKEVTSMDDLPCARAVLFDVTPRQLLRIAGERFPASYVRGLQRFRYGPGVFKLDYALDGPVPWKSPQCLLAGTVHLGGTFEEIALSERQIWQGIAPDRPYVLVAQQSLFDPTRAPAGKHTLWVYCHVPNGSTFDMTERIENQIERFAPGFRESILARHIMNTIDMEQYNANYIGGDINGGVLDLRQLFTRPVPRLDPYSTPAKGIYLCSSSTPPGGGVHGMCGYFAAQSALRSLRGV